MEKNMTKLHSINKLGMVEKSTRLGLCRPEWRFSGLALDYGRMDSWADEFKMIINYLLVESCF